MCQKSSRVYYKWFEVRKLYHDILKAKIFIERKEKEAEQAIEDAKRQSEHLPKLQARFEKLQRELVNLACNENPGDWDVIPKDSNVAKAD